MQRQDNNLNQYIRRKTFFVGDTKLVIEDRVFTFMPWRSTRTLRIAGTNAYYSVIPLSPSQHRLLCFTFCEDALAEKAPDFCRHALILGCGGGAVPRWLLEEYPSLQVDVVDRSPEIISVCKKYFLPQWEESDRLVFHCTDAQDYKPPNYRYQFIFCDLFNGEQLAPFVYDRKFAEKLHHMISEDGILIVNCGWHHLDDVQEAYRPVFKYLQVIERKPWQTEVIQMSDSRFPSTPGPDPSSSC
ncbi:MAG: methyltransferase domain-containing protein [Lachnospiraceae bacterium]|nr:methyltransferase domain-containing protein [Lachnospiraceae bacterium]